MILCDYECPRCGVFETLVDSPAPDEIDCPECFLASHWVPAAVFGKVRNWEVQRGGWQKPERPTWTDTRDLGEGQELHEWQEKRRAVWDEERKKDSIKYARGEL